LSFALRVFGPLNSSGFISGKFLSNPISPLKELGRLFFIAVNNPVVQELELLPYANFYQGCYKLSEMWTKKWRAENRVVPLDQYALFECDDCLKDKVS
jgi:hypothetical protein